MRQYITLQEAARLTPVPVSQCTLWRWCAKGFYQDWLAYLQRRYVVE